MEIVAILRLLRRHRLLAALGVPLAVLIGLSMVYRVSLLPPHLGSRQTVTAVATQRVLVSAPDLPNVALDADSHHTLPTRTLLLADYLATDVVRDDIAHDVGLPASGLTVLAPDMGAPPLEISLAVEASQAAAAPTGPYLLTVSADGQIPTISLNASAPDRATAAALTRAAVSSLRRTVAAKSGPRPGLLIQRLGDPTVKPIFTGPKKAMGAGAAFVFLVLWCAAIAFVAGLRGRRRPARPRWTPSGEPV